ncbi:MAG: NHLP leader peptide family RiPP precursor [Rivularia sp. (in: cyanobacteria)]
MFEQTEQTPEVQIENQLIARALQDASFKQQLLAGGDTTRAAIEQQIDGKIPQDLQVRVLEETANRSYIVLPSQEMSEEELETVAGGGCSRRYCRPRRWASGCRGRRCY